MRKFFFVALFFVYCPLHLLFVVVCLGRVVQVLAACNLAKGEIVWYCQHASQASVRVPLVEDESITLFNLAEQVEPERVLNIDFIKLINAGKDDLWLVKAALQAI